MRVFFPSVLPVLSQCPQPVWLAWSALALLLAPASPPLMATAVAHTPTKAGAVPTPPTPSAHALTLILQTTLWISLCSNLLKCHAKAAPPFPKPYHALPLTHFLSLICVCVCVLCCHKNAQECRPPALGTLSSQNTVELVRVFEGPLGNAVEMK